MEFFYLYKILNLSYYKIMKKWFTILILFIFNSCAIFRFNEVKDGQQYFGKGRLYIENKGESTFMDFLFFYEKGKLKIEGLSLVGTPVFHLFLSEETYLVVPKSSSYWKGELSELTKFFLDKEISKEDIFSIFSGKDCNSFEIKNNFKNFPFPKEIYWKERTNEGNIKIKWVKRTSGIDMDVRIPSSYKYATLEQISK